MKNTLNTLIILLSFLGILYLLFSVGNGSFDFAIWKENSQKLGIIL